MVGEHLGIGDDMWRTATFEAGTLSVSHGSLIVISTLANITIWTMTPGYSGHSLTQRGARFCRTFRAVS